MEGSGETPEPETPEPETFTWTPKDGSDPIVLPHAATAIPKGKYLRFLYQMNKRRDNFVDQVTYAMGAAGVTEALQDRVFDLDDEEITELVSAWTDAATGAMPGES